MNTQRQIERQLRRGLAPSHLEVVNESGMHNVPPGSETHFKVIAVSTAFAGRRALERHRMVHELLQAQLKGGVHALSLVALSPDEWRERGARLPQSPPCLGGGGRRTA